MNDSLCSLVARDVRSNATGHPRGTAPDTYDRSAITAIDVLGHAVAVTRMLALRCRREYSNALRLACPPLAAVALEHMNDVRTHVSRIGERLEALGGSADRIVDLPLPPDRLDALAPNALRETIVDDLAAVRAAIDRYHQLAARLATVNLPAHRLLAEVIDGENAWADDLAALLGTIATPAAS